MYVRYTMYVSTQQKGADVEQVTPTEFRANSSKVFNAVQEFGKIEIVSKNRPKMILITEKKLKEITEAK